MREKAQQRIGGTAVNVADCRIWAEIFYLDSATDYRECLPGMAISPTRTSGGLVMLDDAVRFAPGLTKLLAAALCVSLMLVSVVMTVKLCL